MIIPSFAIQRAQDVLWDLHLIYATDPTVLGAAPILLDAPMARSVHPVLRSAVLRDTVSSNGKARPAWLGRQVLRELDLDPKCPADLTAARTVLTELFRDGEPWGRHIDVGDDTQSGRLHERMSPRWWSVPSRSREIVVRQQRPVVVIATAGMADAGPVQSWLRAWLEDPRATVLFSGYCSRGSLGDALLQLAAVPDEERRLLQEPLPLPDTAIRRCDVQARIDVVGGYSAHADQRGLVEWAFPTTKSGRRFPIGRRVLITHGEPTARRMLREKLLERAAREGFDLAVDLPRVGGSAIDVRTGDLVPRDEVLCLQALDARGDPELDDASRRVSDLEAENAALRRRLAALEVQGGAA